MEGWAADKHAWQHATLICRLIHTMQCTQKGLIEVYCHHTCSFWKSCWKHSPFFFLFSPPCISETSQAEDKADSWLVFLAGKWTCIYIALLSRPTLWSTCHIKPFAHRRLTCRVFHLSISGWAQGHWIFQFSHQWTAALPPDPRRLLRVHQQ